MTPQERELALRKKAEKQARKGITQPDVEFAPSLIEAKEAFPEEPAIKPRRRRTQAA